MRRLIPIVGSRIALGGFAQGFNLIADGGGGDFPRVDIFPGHAGCKAFCQNNGEAMCAQNW